jgi:hypothetical protein
MEGMKQVNGKTSASDDELFDYLSNNDYFIDY